MTTILSLPPESSVDIETASWVRLSQRRADLPQAGGHELLEQSMRQWPANGRLATAVRRASYRGICAVAAQKEPDDGNSSLMVASDPANGGGPS